jgi:acyl carrier protein phosphodiesterase
MYVLKDIVKQTPPTPKNMVRVQQQLEVEYWLSQALESGCYSLECSG